MSSKERSKGKSTEKSKEKKAGSKKASAAASESAFLATAASIHSALAKIPSAYNNINDAELNARFTGSELDDISFVPAGSASAAVPAPRLKKSVTSLEHASAAVASSSAAAVRSPSPKAFAKVVETLDETSRMIARVKADADAALAAAVKTQLASDSKLGDEMISYLNTLPPMVQCTQIKLFLSKLWSSPESKIKERARAQLHPYLTGAKALPCTIATTEKDVAMYLIDIIGISRKAGEPARGILFRTDIFHKETIPGLPLSASEALDRFFLSEWNKFRSSKGGSRKRRRRLNRTKKI
jgi:hypothetical protein